MQHFDLLRQILVTHVFDLLTQIPAEGSGCRWGQLVSLIRIHGGAMLLDVDSLLDFTTGPETIKKS